MFFLTMLRPYKLTRTSHVAAVPSKKKEGRCDRVAGIGLGSVIEEEKGRGDQILGAWFEKGWKNVGWRVSKLKGVGRRM